MTYQNNEILPAEEQRKYLLSDQTYALLIDAQRKIREATEITPHLRKIVNEIITPKAVEAITQAFIKRYEDV